MSERLQGQDCQVITFKKLITWSHWSWSHLKNWTGYQDAKCVERGMWRRYFPPHLTRRLWGSVVTPRAGFGAEPRPKLKMIFVFFFYWKTASYVVDSRRSATLFWCCCKKWCFNAGQPQGSKSELRDVVTKVLLRGPVTGHNDRDGNWYGMDYKVYWRDWGWM